MIIKLTPVEGWLILWPNIGPLVRKIKAHFQSYDQTDSKCNRGAKVQVTELIGLARI